MPYLSHDIRIVVRIYANTKGLARACALARIVESPSYVEQFAKGFTQSQPLFDFVDTGEGKERADYKIKGRQHHSEENREIPLCSPTDAFVKQNSSNYI
jgi:hypothetical protein